MKRTLVLLLLCAAVFLAGCRLGAEPKDSGPREVRPIPPAQGVGGVAPTLREDIWLEGEETGTAAGYTVVAAPWGAEG